MKNASTIYPVHLEFFSPAPAWTPGFLKDIAPVMLLNRYHSKITAFWRAVPAPDHIKKIDQLPSDLKKHSLPIVPSTDFIPARLGKGPEWHGYPRAHENLRFVACTGVVAFGAATYDPDIREPTDLIGKKIGVTPRPSSLRIMVEGILRDGWGIGEQVELVDVAPPRVKEMLLKGDIDATFWVQVWEVLDGFQCLDIGVIEARDTHWVSISLEDIERINQNNSWKTHRILVPGGSATGPKLAPPVDVGMAGFSTAICAWDCTEEEVVYELIRFLDEKSELWSDHTNGCPMSLARMSRFPGLSDDMVHPGAMKYYKERGIEIRDLGSKLD
ncbi:MAG: ABC transporter substrate-binding protein [Deltaproteobacteria bacterium]|nr:ABC transporter substrate-binding protein [Deltaproteobacteria bacterium]